MKTQTINTYLLLIAILFITACSASRRLEKANNFYEDGQYFKAIEMYKKAYKNADRKQKKEIYFKLGESYLAINESRDAERWLKRAVRAEYEDTKAILDYAQALKMEREYEEAIEQYKMYKELVPDDERADQGIEACEKAMEWLENPNRYVVTNFEAINTRQNDFCPTFADNDYTELYFTSSREESKGDDPSSVTGNPLTDIFKTRKDRKGDWSTPIPLESPINIENADDGAPMMNERFNALYYTRCIREEKGNFGCQIYVSYQAGNSWEEPKIVKVVRDSSLSVGHPTLSPDELTMYFAAKNLEDGRGENDLWMVTRKKKTYPWSKPVNLGAQINTEEDEMFPYMRNDSTLYFASNGHPGMGGLDIFKAVRNKNGEWRIENMQHPINSPADDFGIVFEGNKESGFFSSSRDEGKGSDDIWQFGLPPIKLTLTGTVMDEETKEPLQNVQIKMVGTNGVVSQAKTDKDGKFNFELSENTDYIITAIRNDYFKAKTKETTKGLNETTNIKTEIYMTKIPIAANDEALELENIVYAFNKWDLRPEAKVALNELIEIMKENPKITIELRSHTDYVGTTEYNDTLSQKRAQSVVNYLIENGISEDRLVPKGYGETKPVEIDEKLAEQFPFFKTGDVLTEEYIRELPEEQQETANQINRRTEFTVLSTDYDPSKKKKEKQENDENNK